MNAGTCSASLRVLMFSLVLGPDAQSLHVYLEMIAHHCPALQPERQRCGTEENELDNMTDVHILQAQGHCAKAIVHGVYASLLGNVWQMNS